MEHELARAEAEIKKLIQSIKDGNPGTVLRDEAIRLEAQRTDLRARLERAAEPPPLLHPNMADLYRDNVRQLAQGLQQEESRTEAAEPFEAWSTRSSSRRKARRSQSSYRGIWPRC